MKKYLLLTCITCMLIALVFVERANAVSFTQNEFTTAQSLDSGMAQVGVCFSLGNEFKSFYPQVRYGVGALFEVGAKAGALINADPNDSNGVLMGADVKYQLIRQTEGVPVDMALDLGFDTSILSGQNVSELKFSAIFSRSFALTDRGYKLTPYGGLQVSALYGSYLSNDQTNFYVFGGLEWKLTQKLIALVELKSGNATVGGVAIRFEF